MIKIKSSLIKKNKKKKTLSYFSFNLLYIYLYITQNIWQIFILKQNKNIFFLLSKKNLKTSIVPAELVFLIKKTLKTLKLD
jgi:hypothetical protein